MWGVLGMFQLGGSPEPKKALANGTSREDALNSLPRPRHGTLSKRETTSVDIPSQKDSGNKDYENQYPRKKGSGKRQANIVNSNNEWQTSSAK